LREPIVSYRIVSNRIVYLSVYYYHDSKVAKSIVIEQDDDDPRRQPLREGGTRRHKHPVNTYTFSAL